MPVSAAPVTRRVAKPIGSRTQKGSQDWPAPEPRAAGNAEIMVYAVGDSARDRHVHPQERDEEACEGGPKLVEIGHGRALLEGSVSTDERARAAADTGAGSTRTPRPRGGGR